MFGRSSARRNFPTPDPGDVSLFVSATIERGLAGLSRPRGGTRPGAESPNRRRGRGFTKGSELPDERLLLDRVRREHVDPGGRLRDEVGGSFDVGGHEDGRQQDRPNEEPSPSLLARGLGRSRCSPSDLTDCVRATRPRFRDQIFHSVVGVLRAVCPDGPTLAAPDSGKCSAWNSRRIDAHGALVVGIFDMRSMGRARRYGE